MKYMVRLEKLVSLYLDEEIPRGSYLKRKDEIMRTLAALKEKKQATQHGRNNWLEPLREWILDIQQATFLVSNPDLAKLKSFVQKIGTNHAVRDKTARFSFTPPSDFIAEQKRIFSDLFLRRSRSGALSRNEIQFCAWGRARTADPLFFRQVL